MGVPGDDGGCEASGVAHKSPGVGDEEGGREASGVAEKPGGGRHGVGGGVELPQGADTPGVDEVPQGDETPGVLTSTEIGPREDGRGRGGDENPPTARATRTQGADGIKGGPMGGPRMAEPPGTETETAVENGITRPLPRKSYGANGARSERGVLARHEYNLLALEATEGVEPTMGPPVMRPAVGPRKTRKERKQRKRGKKPCSTHFPREATTEARKRGGDPPNGRARLTRAASKEGKEGGDPPPSSARPRRASGATRGPP